MFKKLTEKIITSDERVILIYITSRYFLGQIQKDREISPQISQTKTTKNKTKDKEIKLVAGFSKWILVSAKIEE